MESQYDRIVLSIDISELFLGYFMKNTDFGRQGFRFVNRMWKKYERLTVIGFAGKDKRHQALWLCKCDCGTEKVLHGSKLGRPDGVRSCGCLAKESESRFKSDHGMSKHPLFAMWKSMIHRCHSVKNSAYPRYGGRGIFVCEEWRQSFEKFLSDMMPKPS